MAAVNWAAGLAARVAAAETALRAVTRAAVVGWETAAAVRVMAGSMVARVEERETRAL